MIAQEQITQEQLKTIPLLDFVNTFPDWKAQLKEPPFHLSIREKDEYVLLKYNQFESDMNYLISQLSRGCVLRQNPNGSCSYVCRPFDKFFNYGEPLAADIDWNTARVTEKVDGSLMKLWYDNGSWHLSTNGIIDAFEAPAGEKEVSFGDVFVRALGTDIQTLGSTLDKTRTYMFELTSPETQVVISYPDGVYYLASRSTETGEEYFDRPQFVPQAKIKYPQLYYINNLDDVISAAQLMSKDEEGFVVNDAAGKRIKVKSPEYLIAAHMQMNGQITVKRIFKMIRNEQLDDFLAYAPEQKEKADKVLDAINVFCENAENEWKEMNKKEFASQKEFAEEAKRSQLRSFPFAKRTNPETTAAEWLMKISVKSA
ncbi:MAG: hypothetical protein IJI14_05030, partial [Anaerolineaceae bacterium]|nr:hypothetical protein [Anaerolineaceae bacterium]